MPALKHKHWFTALVAHFGVEADTRQKEHIHYCLNEGPGGEQCDRVLIGPGYYCSDQIYDGEKRVFKSSTPHRRETL